MKNSLKSFISILMVILNVGIFGETKGNSKIEFTDLKGREIVLNEPANRVFLGFYPESYLAVAGDFDKVVSMAGGEWKDFFYDQYKAYNDKMPEVSKIIDAGSIYKGSFSMETLIQTKPEIAIVAPFQYDILADNVSKLEKSGVKVIVIDYNSQTLEKHLKSTEILGRVTGNDERAKGLMKRYSDAIADVKMRVAKVSKKKKVYIELGNLGADEIGNSYGNYLWGSIVEVSGGDNIALGKVASYGALSSEYIMMSNPKVIFFAGSNWVNDTGNRVLMGFNVTEKETSQRIKPYTKRKGWKHIDAIKTKDVHGVYHGGLRSIYDYVYFQYIGKSIYPELFEDIDPKKNLEDFYMEYLPINPEGTFMTKYNES